MKVAILGDVHGHWSTLNGLLMRARDELGAQAAIQVGDLGIDRHTLKRFTETEGRFALPLYVIDGNHEDHGFIKKAMHRGHTGQWSEQLNLIFQPRASVRDFAGTSVGFLGGALHVVRPQQHGLFTGSPNYVRQVDARRAANLFNHAKPTLIVTHSCPSGIGIGMAGHPALGAGLHEHVVQAGFDPGPEGDRGEAALRSLWDLLLYRPRLWVFGHFHQFRQVEIETTQFTCLPAVDGAPLREIVCWDSKLFALTREST